MEATTNLPFDALPSMVREDIFLHLDPDDLNECQTVSAVWRDLVANRIKRNRWYLRYQNDLHLERVETKKATRRRVFGTIIRGGEIEVNTLWMLASCDETEKMLYTLTKPISGNDWSLKQYSCTDDHLLELKTVTLVTSHFLQNMQFVAGHLVIFRQPRENNNNNNNNNNNMPAVFNVASIPWGGRLPIESCTPLPGDSYHFTRLILGRDCLLVVSKNAHVTWTYSGGFRETTHQNFEKSINRPVVVHKLTKEAGTWQEVTRLYPEHEFGVMEKFSRYPNKQASPQYKKQACLLYLSNNIITERYILVSCPLHGSYQMFDYTRKVSMWQLNMPQLPFENIRSILRNAQNNSSEVLAAIRHNYVLIYAEEGMATLVSVRDGRIRLRVEGCKFVLSDRFVMPVEDNARTVRVVDSVTGSVSPTFNFPRACVSTDVHQDSPWYHDDNAYADFENIATQLQLNGNPSWPVFQLKAESYWGSGHAMLDSHRMVYWVRRAADKFIIRMGNLRLDEE